MLLLSSLFACAEGQVYQSQSQEPVDVVADTYEEDCLRDWYFYCPPLDAVWRKSCVVDICDDDKIISCGECIELFECDPTGETYRGLEVCSDVDGNEGMRKKWCDKGFWHYGDCEVCVDEVCDGKDNDCDGDTDEGIFPCSSECGEGESVCIDGALSLCNAPVPSEEICDGIDNDCDDLVDEGQLNECGECGSVDYEICDNVDNDCDGDVDEDLFEDCSTACGVGYRSCHNGQWGKCSANEPKDEVCDGVDNDCDGLIDNGITCECSVSDVGTLSPCMEPPLLCGQGWKTCACVDKDCKKLELTECAALCVYVEMEGECDPKGGVIIPELCNNHDDDCDELIDEDLTSGCYTGPPGTENVGICQTGMMECQAGKWGNFDESTLFIPGLCDGEVLPLPEDICDGSDGNCDGFIDKELLDTDILFVIDGSGSMLEEITAVVDALLMFSSHYQDETVLQWGLVVGPTELDGKEDSLVLKSKLSKFQNFMSTILQSDEWDLGGAHEMLYDALYLSVLGLIEPDDQPFPAQKLSWGYQVGGSQPIIQDFNPGWREDVNRVIVVFTDEEGQSYLKAPGGHNVITQKVLAETLAKPADLSVYSFTDTWSSLGYNGWKAVSVGGSWFKLKTDSIEMYSDLLQLLEESACGASK